MSISCYAKYGRHAGAALVATALLASPFPARGEKGAAVATEAAPAAGPGTAAPERPAQRTTAAPDRDRAADPDDLAEVRARELAALRDRVTLRRTEAAKEARREREEAAARLAGAEDSLRQLRRELGEKFGRVDVSARQLRQDLFNLESQRESLELDQAAARGRRQALIDAAARTAAEAGNSVQSDESVVQLKALVETREAQAARVKQLTAAGAAAASELDRSLAQVAEAKANLAQRQAEVSSARGGDSLKVWNHELVELTIAEQERAARLEYINNHLKDFKKFLDLVDELDRREQIVRQLREAAAAPRADSETLDPPAADVAPPPPAAGRREGSEPPK